MSEFDRIVEPLVAERAERLRHVSTTAILREFVRRGYDVTYSRAGLQITAPDGHTVDLGGTA